jgi:hypothetical protein
MPQLLVDPAIEGVPRIATGPYVDSAGECQFVVGQHRKMGCLRLFAVIEELGYVKRLIYCRQLKLNEREPILPK